MQIVQGEGDDDAGDEGVGERPDFEVGGADEKLRGSGLEEGKIEFSVANGFREFDEARHKKGGKDLLNELVGGDEDNHLGPTPAGDGIDVLINHIDKGELQNKPGQLHDDPKEKVCPKGEFTRSGEAYLNEPKPQEMEK